MAIIELNPPRWGYDTVTKTLKVVFPEPMPPGTPDAHLWKPQFDYVMTMSVPVLNKIAHLEDTPATVIADPIIVPTPVVEPQVE